MLRLLGPKTLLYQALAYVDAKGKALKPIPLDPEPEGFRGLGCIGIRVLGSGV